MAQVAFDTVQRQTDIHTVTGALARSLRLRDAYLAPLITGNVGRERRR